MDDGRSIALIGSVFLPSMVWDPLAELLRDAGYDVLIVDLAAARTPADALQRCARSLAGSRSPVAIAHSNAGNLIPSLAADGRIGRAVFLDAVLPDGAGDRGVVPPGALPGLEDLAVDGLLPPWTRWWPRADLECILPDPSAFELIDAAAPRVPIEYARARIDQPRWPSRVPGAYLALSAAYAADVERATSWGWPTARLDVGHLGIVSSAEAVARELTPLLGE